jgi:hypothetical protein
MAPAGREAKEQSMRLVRKNTRGRGPSAVTTRRRRRLPGPRPQSPRIMPTSAGARTRRRSARPDRVPGAEPALTGAHESPVEIELVQTVVLIVLVVFGIMVVLPALLDLAAAPFR